MLPDVSKKSLMLVFKQFFTIFKAQFSIATCSEENDRERIT